MHREWYARQTNLYLAPTKEVKDNLVSLGACPENILVTGVPVRQQFLGEIKYETANQKSEKQIMIMGGGLGIIPGLENILYTLHGMPGVRTTVITGKNQKLYDKWAGRFDDVEMLGYVDNIGSYMQKADLVITKAGGITLFELIHSRVPMFIIRPFLEQEIVNARYAQEKGFAQVVWDEKEDYAAELRSILQDPGRLREMKKSMIQAYQEIMETELSEAVRIMEKNGAEYLSIFDFISTSNEPGICPQTFGVCHV